MHTDCYFYRDCLERIVFRHWCRHPSWTLEEVVRDLALGAANVRLGLRSIQPLTLESLKARNEERLARVDPRDTRMIEFLTPPASEEHSDDAMLRARSA